MEDAPRRIVIVGERAWRPQVQDAFRDLTRRQRDVAAAALRTLHDLHVGLTPELAAGLALALGPDRRRRSAPEPWAGIFERLAGQLVAPDDAERTARRRHTGMVPGSAPFYAVARIAAPLVARASEALDRIYLFAAEAEPCPEDFEQSYRRYSAQLSHQLAVLASSAELSEVFWADRALTLSQLSRSGSESSAAGLPDVDGVALATLLRLEPELAARPSVRRSLPRRLTSSPRYRPLLNRNEGGVDGIHQTRRLADLPNVLKSEFLNPRPLVLERLLQSGYLALRRPPLREKQRDVLVAGILPPSGAPPSGAPASMTTALVKASWFDAMVRLSVWLRRAGLQRSELLWIEAGEGGRQRGSRCLLERLPEALQPLDEPTLAYRKEFLASLGWLPGYLDRHASGRWPAAAPKTEPLDWAVSAWRGQHDHPHWQPEGERLTGGLVDLDREAYDTVHLMLFLPRKLEKTTAVGALRHAFGLPPEPGYSVSVTWTPAAFTDLDVDTGWAVAAERWPVRPLGPGRATEAPSAPAPSEPSPPVRSRPALSSRGEGSQESQFENRLAGALLDVWLKTILEELLRDD